MTANPTVEWVQPSRAFTPDDLARMPDDGHRYELIDGVLVVAPAPSRDHQRALVRLVGMLLPSCPAELELLVAPFDVDLGDSTRVQPDLLIAPRAQFTSRSLEGAPLLAVEILSPSTRHLDLAYKRARYEAAGCPSYWVIDPVEPSVIAWQLVDGEYSEAGRALGEEALSLSQPFPVTVVPSSLTD